MLLCFRCDKSNTTKQFRFGFSIHFGRFSLCFSFFLANRAAIESINSNYFSYFNVNNNNNNNGQVIGGNSNGSNANNQWSVWQQFQWPYVQPEQNRWSKSHIVCVFVGLSFVLCPYDLCVLCASAYNACDCVHFIEQNYIFIYCFVAVCTRSVSFLCCFFPYVLPIPTFRKSREFPALFHLSFGSLVLFSIGFRSCIGFSDGF